MAGHHGLSGGELYLPNIKTKRYTPWLEGDRRKKENIAVHPDKHGGQGKQTYLHKAVQ